MTATIASASVEKIREFSTIVLCNSTWAFAKFIVCDMPLMQAVGVACLDRLGDFQPRDLATIVWSAAHLQRAHQYAPLLETVASTSVRLIQGFGAQDLSNLAWAYAALASRPAPLYAAIASKTLHTEVGLRELSSIAWTSLNDLSGGGLTGAVESSKFSGGSYENSMNKAGARGAVGAAAAGGGGG